MIASPLMTTLGGTCCSPSALRKRLSTTTILVNEVTMTATKGAIAKPTTVTMTRAGLKLLKSIGAAIRDAHAERVADRDDLAAADARSVRADIDAGAFDLAPELEHVTRLDAFELAERQRDLADRELDAHRNVRDAMRHVARFFVDCVHRFPPFGSARRGAGLDHVQLSLVHARAPRTRAVFDANVIQRATRTDDDDVAGAQRLQLGEAERRAFERDGEPRRDRDGRTRCGRSAGDVLTALVGEKAIEPFRGNAKRALTCDAVVVAETHTDSQRTIERLAVDDLDREKTRSGDVAEPCERALMRERPRDEARIAFEVAPVKISRVAVAIV